MSLACKLPIWLPLVTWPCRLCANQRPGFPLQRTLTNKRPVLDISDQWGPSLNEAKVHLLRRLWGLSSLPPQQLRRSQPYYWRGSGSAVVDFVRNSVGRETATAAGGCPGGKSLKLPVMRSLFTGFYGADITYLCVLFLIHVQFLSYSWNHPTASDAVGRPGKTKKFHRNCAGHFPPVFRAGYILHVYVLLLLGGVYIV